VSLEMLIKTETSGTSTGGAQIDSTFFFTEVDQDSFPEDPTK